MREVKISLMEMTIVINGCTFTKPIGEHDIYSEEYGEYLKGTEYANDFATMVAVAGEWLSLQD
jgi:hypothetical protein